MGKHLLLEDPYAVEGETVVLRERHHYAALIPPLLSLVGAGAAATYIGWVVSPETGSDLVDTVVGLVATAFAARFGWKYAEWRRAHVVVTNRRIYEVTGIFNRKVASMPLWKVTDMTFRRTIPGIVFRYGAMALETAGQAQALGKINYLRDPMHFYETVSIRSAGKLPYPMEQSRAAAARTAASQSRPPPDQRDTTELYPAKRIT